MLGARSHATTRNDPFLPGPAATALPMVSNSAPEPRIASVARARIASGRRGHVAPRSVRTELTRLARTGAISAELLRRYRGILAAAEASVHRLQGTRAAELGAVLGNLHSIAVAGNLTAGRLPALFMTLARNLTWWSTGPLLSPGQRVEFAGSELVWEYYAGQGIELQQLGSFGKANGLYVAGRAHYPQMLRLLAELIPLAAQRGRGLAWEYYFQFDGGAPPWTSAMSQATALEALTRAYFATHRLSYLTLARSALPVFSAAPPLGVSVQTRLGRRYLLYSFAPGAAVINGFLQTLIGLYDFAMASGDHTAAALFAAGDAEARAEVPHYDTGAWSLYEPGQEDTLDYHILVTGFLRELCDRLHAPLYCMTAANFVRYLTTPPALELLGASLHRGRSGTISFRLSKLSHVGIVLTRDGPSVFFTSAGFGYGVHSFSIPALSRRGSYGVRLAATDQAGNFDQITGVVQVVR